MNTLALDHSLKSQHRCRPMDFNINIVNIGWCYRVNFISDTSKPNRILLIYMGNNWYLKPWLKQV